MSKMPLKYTEEMFEKVKYAQSATGGREVQIIRHEIVKDAQSYLVYHYGTHILTIHPDFECAKIEGGWSATDQSIINSFLHLYNIPQRCKRHDDVLTLVRV